MAALIAAAVVAANRRAHSAAPDLESDASIRQLLRTRIDVEKRSVGMAVGVASPEQTRVITWGRQRLAEDRPVTADTLFQIASITKIFTCLLMAEMASRGLLAFDDPVSRHLPADFRLPQLQGRPITLADLATHTAGLPRFPPFASQGQAPDWRTTMSRYTELDFKAWLAEVKLDPFENSAGWGYSNAGYTLLGLALAHRGGRPYEALLRSRVLEPLRLEDTTFHPTRAMGTRLAASHDAALAPLPPFELGIFAAAGALRSTARDLARFAAAILPGSGSRFAKLNAALLSIQRPAVWAPWMPSVRGNQALGWEVRTAPGGPFLNKDGVTDGQTSSLVIDTSQPLAIIVLSNTSPDLRSSTLSGGGIGAADIAQHLLRPAIPLGGQDGALY